MRLLVDTNVFVDLFARREGFEYVKLFFKYCYKKYNQTYVTSISLRDAEYILHHIFHDKDLSRKAQHNIYEMCSKVLSVSDDSSIISLDYEDSNDYEDCLLIQTAKENLLDAIVTNNIKDFKNAGIPVFTPKQLCEIWSNE